MSMAINIGIHNPRVINVHTFPEEERFTVTLGDPDQVSTYPMIVLYLRGQDWYAFKSAIDAGIYQMVSDANIGANR